MIKKVLIAEDHEIANISIQRTLEEQGVSRTDYAFYCDDALARIQQAKAIGQPYDLLITDLFFEEDHRIQKISGGIQLIAAARQVQPELRVLVFSASQEAATIEMLYNKMEIDGYVRKARHDGRELKAAIENISLRQRYFPRHIMQLIQKKNTYEFTDYDITIISLLAQGMLQKDIPAYLQRNQIRPAGLSSVEKRLNHIKEVLEFSKNEQLVAFCKDMGII